MKEISFLGDSLTCIRAFPDGIRQDVGYQLDKVQRGDQPSNFKSMPAIGKGVEEIRVHGEDGAYRVIYTARMIDTVFVLHAFQKKTQTTPKRDIELARKRYKHLQQGG